MKGRGEGMGRAKLWNPKFAQLFCIEAMLQFGLYPVSYTHLDVYKRQTRRLSSARGGAVW